MKKIISLSLFVLISACKTIGTIPPKCTSYADCPDLIGSVKPTREMIKGAKERNQPVMVYGTPPFYPREAYSRNIEGYVMVQFDIDENGDPFNIKADESNPEALFDKSAVNAVRYFKYEKRESVYIGHKIKITFKVDN